MGELADVTLWQNDTCDSCGEKKQSNNCCSIQTLLIKIAVVQNVDQLQIFKYVPTAITLLFDIHYLYLLSKSEEATIINSPYLFPPEYSGTDLLIYNCTFLI